MPFKSFHSLNCSKAKVLLLALATSAAVITAGCGMGVNAPAGNGLGSNERGSLGGIAYGGRQGIVSGNVYAFAAGKTGYGSAPKLLASTTTSTDGFGSFSFNGAITCPGTSDPLYSNILYIVISGGQPSTGVTNNSSALLTVVGDCTNAVNTQPFLFINEATTFASATAMQQFFSVGTGTIGGATLDTIGAPASNVQGLTIAANTVPNMVNLNTGVAGATSQAGTGTNITTSATVTITPETAKINTAANILAACVNSDGGSASPCHTLYPAVNATAATDTIQAAYYMASNPTNTVGGTSNIATVYGLATSQSAYSGGLTAQPTDWTVGIAYTSASVCDAGGTIIQYAYDVAIDGSGNVWLGNGSGTTSALFEMSPQGAPLQCSGATGPSRGGPTIDTNGNVWIASGTTGTSTVFSYVSKYVPSTGVTTQVNDPNNIAGKTYAITADGAGNVFFTDAATATNGGLKLYEISSGSSTATAIVSGLASTSPYGLEVDTKGTIVVAQSASGGSTITGIPTTTVGGSTYPTTGTAIARSTAYAGVVDLAFDSTGAFWVANSAGTSLSASTGPGNTTSSTTLTYGSTNPGDANTVTFGTPANVTPIFAGGLSTPRFAAVDGNNNIWLANNTLGTTGSSYSISEFLNNGATTAPTALSPTVTTTVGSASSTNGGFQKSATFFPSPHGLAIDGSGNVWISNTAAVLTEVVGAAGPVVTPHSIALKNNVLGQKP
ncbi:MAG: hypothetical protein P4L10_05060 [Acidobacteriaceae bacterium]|nr:hypothetical protein [Acidobacteriaceae bacterium]